MERESYLELYVSEAQEHLRALNAAILDLESSGGKSGLEEAFRVAHTLKGMSAAMGFDAAAELAHRLEDLLDAVRRGRRKLTARLADELLRLADEVEAAVRGAPGAAPAPKRRARKSAPRARPS
ncbi:MAG: Hpt domain-containing protein, partial [Longimicrobiales bacterium]